MMYLVANDARDVDSVEEAFNELTMEQLNMKVDLVPITMGSYFQQIQMRKLSATTKRTLRGSFRTRADSITDSKSKLSGGRKKYNEKLIEM